MNVDKQFRRLVFAQVLLGVAAFCIAERNVGMMLIAGSLTVLSRYITEGPSSWSMPRWLLNLLAAAAVCWLLLELGWRRAYVIAAMGHFIMWLQIIQLFAPRRNRDYGQVLVLSLMLMIGASILSVSILYGLMLGVYFLLGLWTVLWFQLKFTNDHVSAVNRRAAPTRRAGPRLLRPVVGQRYRWHLRFMAVFIAVVCGLVSAVVFIVLPRANESYLAQYLSIPDLKNSKSGFSNEVNLANAGASTTDLDPVLNMQVSLNGQPVTGSNHSWLLRGTTMDHYDPRTHVWQRLASELTSEPLNMIDGQRVFDDRGLDLRNQYEACLTLRKTSQPLLFTVMPVTYLAADQLSHVYFSPVDLQLSLYPFNLNSSSPAKSNPRNGLSYTIRWPVHQGSPPTPSPLVHDDARRWNHNPLPFHFQPDTYARQWFVQRDRIAALVHQILQSHDLSRDPNLPFSNNDPRIVTVLTDYLRDHYRYSLDRPVVPSHQEPLIDFLFDHKVGHCELFASALAAMCRSINIPTRIVTGYRVSEYNRIGGYYVVRESNAHAWCEVNLGPQLGWHTVDPTPPEALAAEQRTYTGWLWTLREAYDYCEFRWLRSVVAYDPHARTEVLKSLRENIRQTFASPDNWIGKTMHWLADLPRLWRLDWLNYTIAGCLMIIISIALFSLTRTLIIRRNRLAALQLNCLPRRHRRGLSRKLRFYLQMLDLLERHGHERPLWQSPRHFAENLVRYNPQCFEPVLNLTDSFYEIRFGHRQPDETRIRKNMRQLEHALAQRG